MKRHPNSEFYLSIDNSDPLDLRDADWPDAPHPDLAEGVRPGQTEGVLALASLLGLVGFCGLIATALYLVLR